MEAGQNNDSQLAIKVQFDKHPFLATLIKNPTHHFRSPWTQEVSQHLQSQFGKPGEEVFYRIVYRPGASGELMTIHKGPLTGLQTTSVVQGGRITSVAALEKVDGHVARNMIPMLLTMGALNSIHARLSYITDICTDIRNRQISGDKAKLERISEVIVDCFESLIEGDEKLNEANLRRVTNNTDDCFEILSALLDDLAVQHKAKEMDSESFDEYTGVAFNECRKLDRPTAAIRELMQHSVFAAYERYAAARACQVVLSGIYSPSNIGRHKRALEKARDSIRKVFNERLERHTRGADSLRRKINNLKHGYEELNWTAESAQRALNQQLSVIEKLESELHLLLDARIADFDGLAQIFRKGKFDIIVIEGAMIFSEQDSSALENESTLSIEGLPIKVQVASGPGIV
ncbi:hypothetical protein [Paucibacter sp. Y2R2-4]|uniref:hypothetical protein n=1 Tax=Paucibacter sp. Y2R2-4 TaxID=2893553 RepID=UPI0021E46132|nr:hypothetical protein [Paucibacter sp. Y2R2-4]MCV2350812.1 hypothetical protein [Paucibacter sp. Y2R2-4]